MKTIYAEAQPGKVVLKEKELPAPGPGQVLLKAKYSAMSPGTENGLLGEHIVPLPTNIGYAMVAEGMAADHLLWRIPVYDRSLHGFHGSSLHGTWRSGSMVKGCYIPCDRRDPWYPDVLRFRFP